MLLWRNRNRISIVNVFRPDTRPLASNISCYRPLKTPLLSHMHSFLSRTRPSHQCVTIDDLPSSAQPRPFPNRGTGCSRASPDLSFNTCERSHFHFFKSSLHPQSSSSQMLHNARMHMQPLPEPQFPDTPFAKPSYRIPGRWPNGFQKYLDPQVWAPFLRLHACGLWCIQ